MSQLESENAALRRAISLLHRIANLVRESLELEPTCYAVLTGVSAGVGLGLNRAMLFLVDEEDRNRLRGMMAVGPANDEEADRVWKEIEADAPDLETLYQAGIHLMDAHAELDRRIRGIRVSVAGSTPIGLALRRGETVHGEGGDDLGGLLHLPTSIAAPLRGRESIRGVLYADNRFNGRPPDPIAQTVFGLVADHAGRAIENAQRYERVAREARTDSLTGLGHHGTLMARLSDLMESGSEELSLAMIDLDDFKKVNDTLGHLAGDALLAELAGRLRSKLRSREEPFRYGGEEFAVILPGADSNQASAAGDRIREAVANQPFAVGGERTAAITCSVGVATRGSGRTDPRSLIEAADAALLRAKKSGKNRVVLG